MRPQTLVHRLTLQYKRNKSLKDFFDRFNLENIHVVDRPDFVSIMALHQALHQGVLQKDIAKE